MIAKTRGWYQRNDGSLQYYNPKDSKWYTPAQIIKDKGKAALGKVLGIAYRATVLEEAKQLLKGGFNLSKAVGKKSLNIAKSGFDFAVQGDIETEKGRQALRQSNRSLIIEGLNIKSEETGQPVDPKDFSKPIGKILTFKVKGGGIRRILPSNKRYQEYLELHKKGTVLPALTENAAINAKESGETSASADETGKTKNFSNRASGNTNETTVTPTEVDMLNGTSVNEEKIEKKANNIKRAQKAPADLQWIPEEALGGSTAKARAVIEKARAIERTYGFGNAGDERFKSNNEKLKQRLLNSPLDQLTFENM